MSRLYKALSKRVGCMSHGISGEPKGIRRRQRAHGSYDFSRHFLILFANLLSGSVLVRIWLSRGEVSHYCKARSADIPWGEEKTERTNIPYIATPCDWHSFSSDLLSWEFDVFFYALGSSLDDPCLFSQNQESETAAACSPPLITLPSSARPNVFSSQNLQRLRRISSRSLRSLL